MLYSVEGRRRIVLGISLFFLLLWGYAGLIRHDSRLAWLGLLSIDLIFLSRVLYFVAKGVLKRAREKRILLRSLVSRNIFLAIMLVNLHVNQLKRENRDGGIWFTGLAVILLLIALWSYFSEQRQKRGPRQSFYAKRLTPPIASKGR